MFVCQICTHHTRIRHFHVVMYLLTMLLQARLPGVSSIAGLSLSLTFLIMDVLDVPRQVVFAIMYSVVRITMMFVFVNFLNMSI